MLTILLSIAVQSARIQGPAHVKVIKMTSGYQLLVDGRPFLIKGAGGDGSKQLLAACGANSFRTWGADNLQDKLDEAQRLGLKVTIGIWLGHEEQGFHYDNADQVARQLETAEKYILQYRNHPALLMWGIGNEMEGYGSGDNPKIWSAVEDIAKFAKENDPNHPTMTVIAEIGGKKVPSINRYCPDIDVVGINSYGGVASLPDRYRAAGGVKPYVVTEFGPPGVWELPKTSWGAAAEPTSTQKAEIYANAYRKAVLDAKGLCLGSYAFTWGNKQEATATWFGMLLPDGSKLGPVDAMTELWSGKAPAHKCPLIESLELEEPVDVKPGATVHAKLLASDPNGEPLKVKWVLQRETAAYGNNGAAEGIPPVYPDAIVSGTLKGAEVKMPTESTGYRLFAYVSDAKGDSAVGNIALHVQRDSNAPAGTEMALPVYVYQDKDQPMAFTPSGWMGDIKAMKLDLGNAEQPHSGSTCIRFDLNEDNGWGAIAWQNPANDWGDKPGGYNLKNATRLTFWARGAHGGEAASFAVGIIGSDKPYYDTAVEKLDSAEITGDWKQFSIPLKGKDLSRIKTGFVMTLKAAGSPVTIYLDDIRFE